MWYRLIYWIILGISVAVAKCLNPRTFTVPMAIVFEGIIVFLIIFEMIRKHKRKK